jgi:hypothetical protein
MIKVEYRKNIKMWHAAYHDSVGKLYQGFTSKKRDDAIFALGLSMGREPQMFSRPLGEYLTKSK